MYRGMVRWLAVASLALLVMPVPSPGQDCNYNDAVDAYDISSGTSYDCNDNGVPDECELGRELTARWRLDESSGTIAEEEISGYHGTLVNYAVGDPRWTTGIAGNALTFDGIDDHVTHGFGIGPQGTLSHWLVPGQLRAMVAYYESDGTGSAYNGFGHSTPLREIHSSMNSSGAWRFLYQDGASALSVSGGLATLGIWSHVAVTWDTEGDLVLYVNGDEVDRTSMAAFTFDDRVPSYRALGRVGSGQTDRHWNGLMDDVQVYDVVLTPDEIAHLAAGPGFAYGAGQTNDCNGSGVLDECDVAAWHSPSAMAPDGETNDGFGRAVAAWGDVVIAGAPGDDVQGTGSGSAYAFRRSGSTWVYEQTLIAPDGEAGDIFGRTVALCQDTAIIGAYLDVDLGVESGSAYIFRNNPGVEWWQESKLHSPDGEAGDHFGEAVAVWGTVAVVGAPRCGIYEGSAYVYRYAGSTWIYDAKLVPDDLASYDYFGRSVAVCGDWVVVGANYDDDNGQQSGSAYVFHYTGGAWVQHTKLLPDDGAADDRFGTSVAMYADTVVVGAPQDDDQGDDSGSAYVFRLDDDTWILESKLLPTDGAPNDEFGTMVAIYYGSSALVGTDPYSSAGQVYQFYRSVPEWVQTTRFLPVTGIGTDSFGASVALGGDIAVVGAPGYDESAGAVHVFDIQHSDCNGNGIPDECMYLENDCNSNLVPDECDITAETSADCNGNDVPDECIELEDDCNGNGIPDECDIADETSTDCNTNGVPDECDISDETSADCNDNGVPDECIELEDDCNGNGVPDGCDIADETSADCNGNGIPDECIELEDDCNGNGAPDECDIADETSADCNDNSIPDECDIAGTTGADLVFILDTSGSMDDLGFLCDKIDYAISELEAQSLVVDAEILSIYTGRHSGVDDDGGMSRGGCPCCTDTVANVYGTTAPGLPETLADCSGETEGEFEDWGAATAIVAVNKVWNSERLGVIIPISDEGPRCGNPCDDPGSDRDVISHACSAVEDLGISPVAGAGSDSCTLTLMTDLAACGRPGSNVAESTDPDFDLAAHLNAVIGPLYSLNCNENGIPDECIDLENDCNVNGVPDECDIADETSEDCNGNGIPDECIELEDDCNANSIPDECDIADETSEDCNGNGIPDECIELEDDCNANSIPDECDIADETSADCNGNSIPDECDIADETSGDCNGNGIPDECEVPDPLVLYTSSTTYPAGDAPVAVTVGDLDGDGDLDLVTANYNSDDLSVLMNQGDGTFADDALYGAGNGPRAVSLGDLDGDGDLDLALANTSGDDVSVLLNQEDGSFVDDVIYGAGDAPDGIGLGDLDGDGDLDLVTANRYSNDVSVLLNQGDGTFLAEVRYGAGSYPYDIAVADFDADGDLDLAVVNWSGGGNVSILLNHGDGTFAEDSIYSAGGGPRSLAVGDLDHDDDLDLAVVNSTSPYESVTILLNYGDGTFVPDASYDVGADARGVAVGDLDGDGDLDLAVGNSYEDNLSVLLNYGNGTFADDILYGVGDGPYVVVVGNLDGDGDLDLAVSNSYGDDISILLHEDGDCNSNAIPDVCDLDCNDNGIPDDCEITVTYDPEAGASDNDCDGNGIPDECDVADCDGSPWCADCNANGVPDECDIADSTSEDTDSNGIPDECDGPIRYVDDDGPADGYGISWQSPYRDLQDALAAAALDLDITEIRVAGGVYVPSEQSEPGTPRTETFQLLDGVMLAGGYRGCPGGNCGGGDPDERDLVAYETILSGDLLGDDDTGGSNAENAYHVVTASGLDDTAVLDGFSVMAGNANHSNLSDRRRGGGLYNASGTPTIRYCVFEENYAVFGGGFYSGDGNATVTSCVFMQNDAQNGGGFYLYDGYVEVENCLIQQNSATSSGGGGYVLHGNPHLSACTFENNTAPSAAGLMARYDPASLVNCLFTGNVASDLGGGFYQAEGASELVNCTLTGNDAMNNGGGVYSSQGQPALTNCIVWGNTAPNNPQVRGAVTITYSCIEGGGFTGVGNIVDDPLLLGDGWHLDPNSPCTNAGDPNLPNDPNNTDLDGEPRVQQCRVDMGADETDSIGFDCNENEVADACDLEDETSLDCNANLVPDECDIMTGGDFDADGDVDLDDYTALAECFAGPDEAPSPLATECAAACLAAFDADADNDVDLADFALLYVVSVGACCDPVLGVCTVLPEADCAALGHTYFGDGTSCNPNPCPRPGACCIADGSCQVEFEVDCTGIWQGPDSTCDPNPCPQPSGACCASGGACTVETEADCDASGGAYQGDDTTCVPNPCTSIVYENTIEYPSMSFAYTVDPNLGVADDITLAGTARELVGYQVGVIGLTPSFDVTAELHTACPVSSGTLIDGTTVFWEDVPGDFTLQVLDFDLPTPVTLPDTVWVVVRLSTLNAEWAVAETAEVGSTEDLFGLEIDTDVWECDWTLGGFLPQHAGFWIVVECAE